MRQLAAAKRVVFTQEPGGPGPGTAGLRFQKLLSDESYLMGRLPRAH
jgi:hypothetical protein